MASDKLAAADASDSAQRQRAEADERLRRQVCARQEAARREKVHREAARQAAAEQARRAQRKAGSVWHPSRTPSPDALPTLLHGVAVSDENDPHVANNFAPVRAPPIPPSGPIVVQTQRVKAQASKPTASAFAPPPSDEVPTCVEINQCVGCTSAMTRPTWLGRAARSRHRHAIAEKVFAKNFRCSRRIG